MNSNYGPQNHYYGQPQTYYAPAPQPMYAPAPVAPQNSGSGMKMAVGVLALLAIGIGAFAAVFSMRNSETTTTAQSTPQTVFNIPSEINIPALTDSPSTAPVVVNNPAPRVITIPGQAPVQQQPVQQQPVQQTPVQQQVPVDEPGNNDGQAIIQAQKDAEAKAAADAAAKQAEEAAAKKAEEDAANAKAENIKKAAGLKAIAASKRTAANDARLNASLQLPGTPARAAAEQQAAMLDAEAASLEAQAAALEQG